MAIDVQCGCGRSFRFKHDLAGRRVACPDCGTTVSIPAGVAPADAAFDRDRFLLRQKRLAINQIYEVRDDADTPLLYVRRPTSLVRRAVAILAGVVVFIAVAGAAAIVSVVLLADRVNGDSTLLGVAFFLSLLVAFFLTIATVIILSPKRHVLFFRDPTRKECILEVRQDSKVMPLRMTFTVVDPESGPLGTLSKNIFFDVFRKRWSVRDTAGEAICTAFEDSILLSLLRRLLGPLFGLLRTNFLIVSGDSVDGDRIGEFNRNLTLFDRYVLDLSADPLRSFDRRLAVALGVILDTGERR